MAKAPIPEDDYVQVDYNLHRKDAKDYIAKRCSEDPDYKQSILDKAEKMSERFEEGDKAAFMQELENLVNGKLTTSHYFDFEHLVSEDLVHPVHYIGVVLKCDHSNSGHTGAMSMCVKNKAQLSPTNRFVLVNVIKK